jgi:hypothetical protein
MLTVGWTVYSTGEVLGVRYGTTLIIHILIYMGVEIHFK